MSRVMSGGVQEHDEHGNKWGCAGAMMSRVMSGGVQGAMMSRVMSGGVQEL